MQNNDFLIVFEKMYLLENETKEKITIRVQIVFTLTLALIAVSSYILRMLDFSSSQTIAIATLSTTLVFLVLLGASSYFAVRAFWGNTFKQTPSASEIKGYYNALVQYNLDIDKFLADPENGDPENGDQKIDIDAELNSYLCDVFEDCATHNAQVNFSRSRMVHNSFKLLLLSLVPLGVSAIMFIGFDMDVSSPRKNYQVIDKYVGDQLINLDQGLGSLTKVINELKVILMTNRNDDKNQEPQNVPPEKAPAPVQMKPERPERPSVRIMLEDFSELRIKFDHDK